MDNLRIEEKKIGGRFYYDVSNGLMQIPGGPYTTRQEAEEVLAHWRKKFTETNSQAEPDK
jgi:hypothetical protein